MGMNFCLHTSQNLSRTKHHGVTSNHNLIVSWSHPPDLITHAMLVQTEFMLKPWEALPPGWHNRQQTDRQHTGIVTCRLNWPWGRISEEEKNLPVIWKLFTIPDIIFPVIHVRAILITTLTAHMTVFYQLILTKHITASHFIHCIASPTQHVRRWHIEMCLLVHAV